MRFALTSLVLALSISSGAMAQESNAGPAVLNTALVPSVMTRAVDDFIRPGYHRFHETAGSLRASMEAVCATPSAATVDAAHVAFNDTIDAWSRIEIVRVGPVIEDNRFERVLFFPDRKSTGQKQVHAALAKPDDSVTQMATLKDKSVAMQGIGALEFVLFGTGHEVLSGDQGGDHGGYRCRYGAAIAANLERLGGELSAAWDAPDGVQAAWEKPGPANPLFRDEKEAANALLGILVHAAETIRDQRLESFYKGDAKKALPRQAIYWRSGNTFRSVAGNLEGLRDLMKMSGMVDLLDENSRSTVSSIDFVARSLLRVVNDIQPNVEGAIADPAETAKLDFLLLNSRDLILRLNNDLGGGIGLAAGFSFSDGD
ncbi:Peptidase M75, Imelysin [Rhizobium sp. PDO1-076]|uniref:imelysin family protein n=3 Tax=Rhizobium TaxID=379 RepID=UPI00024E2D6F|nr:imelysin family protein [Rhizobium sp. PDO1-076]EHS50325.1 Peptidase M75, Imelysin [Rhizobium sp. PDO1-076]